MLRLVVIAAGAQPFHAGGQRGRLVPGLTPELEPVMVLLGLAATVAWSRAHSLLAAAGIMLVGAGVSVSYVLLHRRLTERLRGTLQMPGQRS